jgi:hypothetical protein
MGDCFGKQVVSGEGHNFRFALVMIFSNGFPAIYDTVDFGETSQNADVAMSKRKNYLWFGRMIAAER